MRRTETDPPTPTISENEQTKNDESLQRHGLSPSQFLQIPHVEHQG